MEEAGSESRRTALEECANALLTGMMALGRAEDHLKRAFLWHPHGVEGGLMWETELRDVRETLHMAQARLKWLYTEHFDQGDDTSAWSKEKTCESS